MSRLRALVDGLAAVSAWAAAELPVWWRAFRRRLLRSVDGRE